VELGGSDHARGVLVGLDPDAIAGLLERAVLDVDVRHILLILVPAQAADADAVAGPAGDAGDVDPGAARADGDAVVTHADGGAGDGDLGGVTNVDAVGVGAVPGRGDGHVLDRHAFALEHVHVEELGVQQGDPGDGGVVAEVEHQRLQLM